MSKVSIIVPIYNSEKYLSKCLDSLVNQTLSDIEIILIDDCSTDKSREIINLYKYKYNNKIKTIYLEQNKGQGYARNIAVQNAVGEYILFVDSDDYIDLEACKILYEKAELNEFDIVCFDIIEIINNEFKEKKLNYDCSIEGNIDINKRKVLLNSQGYFTTRMYRRKLIVDNNIKFPIGIHYEDSVFNTLSLLYANSIAKIDSSLYFYLIRENSSSNSYNKERLYDRITTTEFLFNEVNLRGIYSKYKPIIDKKYIKMMVGNIHLCLDMFDRVNENKMKEISINIKRNIENYKNLNEYKELDKISKLYLNLNDISPKLLIIVDRIYKLVLNILR